MRRGRGSVLVGLRQLFFFLAAAAESGGYKFMDVARAWISYLVSLSIGLFI
jgi:hypothetical protein